MSEDEILYLTGNSGVSIFHADTLERDEVLSSTIIVSGDGRQETAHQDVSIQSQLMPAEVTISGDRNFLLLRSSTFSLMEDNSQGWIYHVYNLSSRLEYK